MWVGKKLSTAVMGIRVYLILKCIDDIFTGREEWNLLPL